MDAETKAGVHTPNWRFEKHEGHSQWLGNIIGSYGTNERGIERVRTIACLTRYEETPGEALANARLAGAATALLNALVDLMPTIAAMERAGVRFDPAQVEAARVAIHSATGGSHG